MQPFGDHHPARLASDGVGRIGRHRFQSAAALGQQQGNAVEFRPIAHRPGQIGSRAAVPLPWRGGSVCKERANTIGEHAVQIIIGKK